MSGNSFGKIFKITTFGESHGKSLGVIIDGCPANINIDINEIQKELNKRRPGYSHNSYITSRNENDRCQILSGIFDGVSTGTPITIIVDNLSQKSQDYDAIKECFRPSHADYTYYKKYGIRDYRGGGRASGRETIGRVAAGAIAKKILSQMGIKIFAYTKAIAGIYTNKDWKSMSLDEITKTINSTDVRTIDSEFDSKINEIVKKIKSEGDSCGGIVECVITGCPTGLGEPVFDKFDAELSKAIMSIGAIKGIEFGLGFECANIKGSKYNDSMRIINNIPTFLSNNSGGILGGISNGNDIIFRCAIKPVPSIYKKQSTINIFNENQDILIEGRHDTCLCPRIIPVIEAMSAICILDFILQQKAVSL